MCKKSNQSTCEFTRIIQIIKSKFMKLQFVEKDLIAINIFAHAGTLAYSGLRFSVHPTYRPKD